MSQTPKRRWGIAVSVLLWALLAAGCTRAPAISTPPAQTPAPVVFKGAAGAAAEALPALVAAERTAARDADIGLLGQLWAGDARIVDSRGTADPSDDYIWEGRDAILDRYRLAVFPAPPPPLPEPVALAIVQEGNLASAVAGSDRWRFQFAQGRWWILELAY